MNRVWRRTAVFIAAAVIAILVAIAVSQSPKSAAPGTELGQPDLAVECRRVRGANAIASLRDENADSWECGYTTNGLFTLEDIDVQAACDDQFADSVAKKIDESPWGWRCIAT